MMINLHLSDATYLNISFPVNQLNRTLQKFKKLIENSGRMDRSMLLMISLAVLCAPAAYGITCLCVDPTCNGYYEPCGTGYYCGIAEYTGTSRPLVQGCIPQKEYPFGCHTVNATFRGCTCHTDLCNSVELFNNFIDPGADVNAALMFAASPGVIALLLSILYMLQV